MTRTPPTFYVLHGEDEFSRKNEVKAMRAKMGDPTTAELNITFIDGTATPVAEILASASMMPFLCDRRMVIVNGLLAWLGRKGGGKTAKAELDRLLAGLPKLPESARLILVEPDLLRDDHPVLKLIREDPHGFARAFNRPQDMVGWIVRQVEAAGGTIERPAAVALASVINGDVRAAEGEVAKLVTYVGTERAIASADVALLTPYTAEANIFDIVDAIAVRDGKTAIRLIHRLLADPKQQPLNLLGMINRQFRLLLQAREVLDAGGDMRNLDKILSISPFVARKLAPQARNFTLDQLESIYRLLLETDQAIKTGRVSDALAIDLLVTQLAG
ncbi:MAG TPA: DNA polymerase III subunit delta [Aggregatilineales bacterium]|nr:DNA polymerase III subunit delta [Aggregatilineales bacterium]